jgi:hypothetical protein
MCIGGEGRLGYLRPASTGVQIDLPCSVLPDGAAPYVYVTAIWPDSGRDARILFGGGVHGGGAASLMESLDRGRQPVQIAIEGDPPLWRRRWYSCSTQACVARLRSSSVSSVSPSLPRARSMSVP